MRVSVSYKIVMRKAVVIQKIALARERSMKIAGLRTWSSAVQFYLFNNNGSVPFKVLRANTDGFPPKSQDKRFLSEISHKSHRKIRSSRSGAA